MRTSTMPRRSMLAAFLAITGSVAVAPPVLAAGDPVPELRRHARPLASTAPGGDLGDLAPLGRTVGGAGVVGLGEATHGSREFFTMKHRVFRYLVEKKGFSAFSLEAGWSSGVRLNEYVVSGKGDPRAIMREEFGELAPWNVQEYLDLLRWMRAHNATHPDKVHFTGNDLNFPSLGRELIGKVTDFVKAHRPDLLPQVESRYRRLQAAPAGNPYLDLPPADRKVIADQAAEVLSLVQRLRPDRWTAQHARSIAQTTRFLAFDLKDREEIPKAMLYRDRVMALNTAWWHEQTGEKVLLSAHNGHVTYVPDDAENYPKTQGAFLRDRLGEGYVNIGFTFTRGAFNAQNSEEVWTRFTVGPPAPGTNEETLARVSASDYYLDLRRLPAGARNWLRQARLTRSIGTGYPEDPYRIALARSYDGLFHLHDINESKLLG
ncbi:erythromycin esterase family protein [Spirillospora sp. CA-294931]|uniref:erythromycin esterase family protein n=1 Tax=Spirillospora sp. CA-294931 TaxID=3240042 RepID=UPI003D933598